ncbi:hypothetical protein J5X84_15435 [Streptosporangiaceae bacterium NEAU-GS5]|nr:hypothetical protein [Streptosporangiaceae bacterium NEAU-GS5]
MERSPTAVRRMAASLGAVAVAGAMLAPSTPVAAAAGAWSVVSVPFPSLHRAGLVSVDSRADDDAWAVGTVDDSQPYAVHWNGAAWSQVPFPTQANGKGTPLWGVSGSRADDVWAVGNFFLPKGYSSTSQAAAFHWNGTSWTSFPVPDSGLLYDVATLGPADAYAVGGGVKHWNGSAWSSVATPSPQPPVAGSTLAVSARTPSDIWVVGLYSPKRRTTAAYSLHYDGTSWQVLPFAEPTTHKFWSIVAAGPGDAWAVGESDSLASTQPGLEHWDGTSWSVVPAPASARGGYLRDVTARSGTDVWAAGLNFTGDANTAAVSTLHWDGRAWTAVATPVGVNGTLWSISTRPGATRLLTVGDSIPGAPLSLERH